MLLVGWYQVSESVVWRHEAAKSFHALKISVLNATANKEPVELNEIVREQNTSEVVIYTVIVVQSPQCSHLLRQEKEFLQVGDSLY